MFGLDDLVNSLLTCAQVIVATFLFARGLPRREPRLGYTAATAIGLVAWSALISLLVPLSFASSAPIALIPIFALTLVMGVVATMTMYDASLWAALFCATAGYTMQNLASGLGSFAVGLMPALEALPYQIRLLFTMALPFAATYALCYRPLISKVQKTGLELIRPQTMFVMMVVVILAVIAYDVVVKQILNLEMAFWLKVSVRLSHALLCVFVLALEYELLYNRRLQQEVSTISQVMESEKAQYELSRETIEAINLKCHDIRHQIRQLGAGLASVDEGTLEDIAREVNVYDSAVHTGNEPLDVILTEKSLVCSREGITLSCIADGSAFASLVASDLYALMGNALDNAIEAVRQLDEHEKRSISLVIRRAGNTAVMHVENYFAGTLSFRDGLPETTKDDRTNHGYGMKSMRLIAQRYHGTLHARTQGDVFHLNVIVPLGA